MSAGMEDAAAGQESAAAGQAVERAGGVPERTDDLIDRGRALVESLSESGFIFVSAGVDHCLALRRDGSLWAWGAGAAHQLGLGDTSYRQVPIRVGDDNDWVAVAAGAKHSLALKSDGSLWSWGTSTYGQLGHGDHENRETPSRVGEASVWVAVAARSTCSFALQRDGSLWSWGVGANGELGLGEEKVGNAPRRVDEADDWAALGVGEAGVSIALKRDGSLQAWGNGEYGGLGLGGRESRGVPTRVGGARDWASVSVGHDHTLALKSDGSLWAWGTGANGQLGLGDVQYRDIPTRVGGADDWAAVAAGSCHSLALKRDGGLWFCGLFEEGDVFVPTRVGEEDDWAAVAAGNMQSLALKHDGSLWVWGLTLGPRGVEDSQYRATPTRMDLGERQEREAMDIFDTDAIKADMEREKAAQESALESCHAWSVAALNGFLKAASEVQTPIVRLDMGSPAAEASGIAIGHWPTTKTGGHAVAEYYRIVQDSSFGVWPAQDGQGLSMATSGEICLKGKEASVEDAAHWLSQVTGNNLETAKNVFDSALRGKPLSVG